MQITEDWKNALIQIVKSDKFMFSLNLFEHNAYVRAFYAFLKRMGNIKMTFQVRMFVSTKIV